MTPLQIVGALLCLGLGVWLGLPGRYEQSQSDIERAMDHGGAKRNRVKRHFTPLDWFRKDQRGSEKRLTGRGHFRTAASSKRSDR